MSFKNKYSNVSNLFYLPSINTTQINIQKLNQGQQSILTLNHGGSLNPNKNLNNRLAPVNKPRFKQDALLWRDAIRLAEQAVLPMRYLMQLQYMDTVLETHLRSCLKRRENLTLRRRFVICDDNGKVNEKWTAFFNKQWFKVWTKYALEAKWYGYTLISMGDIVDGEPINIVQIPRTHISPDRLIVASVPTATFGDKFLEAPYYNEHIWVSTPDEHGLAACGYGLLYEVTLLAISIKNNLNYNIQFLEVFGMPYRTIHTDRTDKENTDMIEAAMELMGSLGYGIFGKDDEVEFIETTSGNGWKAYSDLETRLEKKISKILLGHSDGMEPTVGKGLGNESSNDSPAQKALNDIQSEDGDFVAGYVNNRLFEWCRDNGFNIPKNLHFEYCNDEEENQKIKQTNEQNVSITTSIKNLSQAGYDIDINDIEDKTGFKIEGKKEQPKNVPNKLDNI